MITSAFTRPPRSKALMAAILLTVGVAVAIIAVAVARHEDWLEKRVAIVEPNRLIRGAWQRPWPLQRILDRERVRTIVTLTAINEDDPKYIDQSRALHGRDVDWIIVPMRGSTATVEEMAQAADLLADPQRQPVFFHCVAGHHRTSLVHAAYLIRHKALTADRAWRVVADLPWSEPDQPSDQRDAKRIAEFESWNRDHPARASQGTVVSSLGGKR